MNETKFCQSCGMPLTNEILGTNADGSKSLEYCMYCYKDGAFTGDFDMEEMVEFCSQFVEQYNKDSGQNLTREAYKEFLRQYYPQLKRWKADCNNILTKRLLLRRWQESDAESLYKYASDPEVGPRAGWLPHKSVEESLETIKTLFNSDSMWAIVLKDTGEPIGCIGYMRKGQSNIDIGDNDVEAGYWIARPYWNQGICTEALLWMIDYCFNEKHFHTIWSDYFVDNPASGRVMQKCGFVETGVETTCPSLMSGKDRTVRVTKLNRICQSCGMPMTSDDVCGTNADGSTNFDYCKYCYKDGEFIDKVSMDEYIEMCSQFGAQAGMTNEQMREHCQKLFPQLRRWKGK